MQRSIQFSQIDQDDSRCGNNVYDGLTTEPSWILQFAFFLLVLSLAFDSIRIGGSLADTKTSFGLARLAGYFLFAAALLDFKSVFSRVPKALLTYGIYVGLGIVASLPYLNRDMMSGIITIPQNLVLFWIASNVLRWESGWKVFVFGLLSSVLIIAVGQLSNLGVEHADVVQNYVPGVGMADRASALGEDPNFSAAYRALGAVLGLMVFLQPSSGLRMRVFGVVTAGLAAVSIVGTGSRGALLALIVGVLSVSFLQRTPKGRLFAVFLGSLVLLAVAFLVMRSDLLGARIAAAVESGDTADRTDIWSDALTVSAGSPLWGYGFSTYQTVLGEISGPNLKATHNVLLSVILSSGYPGLFAFIAGTVWIGRGCYRRRAFSESAIALALLITAFAAGMSLNVELKKWFWLVLAAACARSVPGMVRDSEDAATQRDYA